MKSQSIAIVCIIIASILGHVRSSYSSGESRATALITEAPIRFTKKGGDDPWFYCKVSAQVNSKATQLSRPQAYLYLLAEDSMTTRYVLPYEWSWTLGAWEKRITARSTQPVPSVSRGALMPLILDPKKSDRYRFSLGFIPIRDFSGRSLHFLRTRVEICLDGAPLAAKDTLLDPKASQEPDDWWNNISSFPAEAKAAPPQRDGAAINKAHPAGSATLQSITINGSTTSGDAAQRKAIRLGRKMMDQGMSQMERGYVEDGSILYTEGSVLVNSAVGNPAESGSLEKSRADALRTFIDSYRAPLTPEMTSIRQRLDIYPPPDADELNDLERRLAVTVQNAR